jgi:DNA-binding beta-propeller fold protein YncE
MNKLLIVFISLLSLGAGAAWGHDDSDRDRDRVQRFVTLPDGVRFPEGITANPANGDIYVSTFDAPGPTNPAPHNKLLRYNRHGHLLAERDFGSDPLLGLEFDRAHSKVYITTVGDFSGTGSRIQRIDANFNGSTSIENVALMLHIGPPGTRHVDNPDTSFDTITFGDNASVPNALAFDSHGNLYISDSFQGAIFRIDQVAGCATPCVVTTISHDPLLATAGFPPFGANGLAVSGDGKALFVANTGDDRVLKLDLTKPPLSLDAVSVFAESINGADGIVFDRRGRLWVCANQNDEVVALNTNGRVVERLGSFGGIRRDGSPRGLLFPASPVIVGDDMFVTNLAIPLTGAVGDEPEEDVTRWTVSRIELPGL